MAKKYTNKEVENVLNEHGLTSLDTYKNCKTKMKCINREGYYIDVNLDNIVQNKINRFFTKNNRQVLDNIKRYINLSTDYEYDYVSGEFENAYSEFIIRHNKCGKTFTVKQVNINRNPSKIAPTRHGTRCPFCESLKLESSHALILKQVFLKELPGTVVEDNSCINPSTNCPLPTDIVNHDYKIAIEIQSWFHDFDNQKIKDNIKKNYQLSNGYRFFAIDSRDYTILQTIQIFFPTITNIPDYIDFGYANKLDDVKAQDLLNKYMPISKIAKILNCKPHTIYDAIHYKRLTYPTDQKNNSCSSVVQLDLNMNYVTEYDSIKEAQNNTDAKYIASALHHNRHRSGSQLQYYSDDYYNNII